MPRTDQASLSGGLSGFRQLRTAGLVAALRDLEKLSVVPSGRCPIAHERRGPRSTVHGPEAVRLLIQRGLELLARLRRLLQLQQHLSKKLPRGCERARGDSGLLGVVRERRDSAHFAEGVGAPALSEGEPGR